MVTKWNELNAKYKKCQDEDPYGPESSFLRKEMSNLIDKYYTIMRVGSFFSKDDPLNVEMRIKNELRLIDLNCNKCDWNLWYHYNDYFCIVCDRMPISIENFKEDFKLEALGLLYKHYSSTKDPRITTVMAYTLGAK